MIGDMRPRSHPFPTLPLPDLCCLNSPQRPAGLKGRTWRLCGRECPSLTMSPAPYFLRRVSTRASTPSMCTSLCVCLSLFAYACMSSSPVPWWGRTHAHANAPPPVTSLPTHEKNHRSQNEKNKRTTSNSTTNTFKRYAVANDPSRPLPLFPSVSLVPSSLCDNEQRSCGLRRR